MPGRPLEAGLRITALIAILAAIAWRFGTPLTSPLLPLFNSELGVLAPQFQVLSVGISSGNETLIHVEAGPSPVVMVAGKLLPLAPHSRFVALTPAGHLLQPLVLLLGVVLAWPATGRKTFLMRFTIAGPALVVLPLLDVPLVLAAQLEATLLDLVRSDAHSVLGVWSSFLEGGGRLALPLALASLSIAFAESRHR